MLLVFVRREIDPILDTVHGMYVHVFVHHIRLVYVLVYPGDSFCSKGQAR